MDESNSKARTSATLFLAGGVLVLVLLALHPHGAGADLPAIMASEASLARMNAWVHGSMLLANLVLLSAFALGTPAAGRGSVARTVATVAFACGAAAMGASLLLDGMVVPYLAGKFVASADAETRSSLLVMVRLCETLIRYLMPWGVAGQSLGIALWSFTLLGEPGCARVAGAAGLCVGFAVCTGLLMLGGSPLLLMAALFAAAIWCIAVGACALRVARREAGS